MDRKEGRRAKLDVVRKHTGEILQKAIMSIRRIGPPAARYLCDTIEDADMEFIVAIVPVLGDIGNHKTLPYLDKMNLSDPEVAVVKKQSGESAIDRYKVRCLGDGCAG
jgi:hypothetical protein